MRAMTWPPRTVIRRSSGLRTLESALYRSGPDLSPASTKSTWSVRGPLVGPPVS